MPKLWEKLKAARAKQKADLLTPEGQRLDKERTKAIEEAMKLTGNFAGAGTIRGGSALGTAIGGSALGSLLGASLGAWGFNKIDKSNKKAQQRREEYAEYARKTQEAKEPSKVWKSPFASREKNQSKVGDVEGEGIEKPSKKGK